MTTFAEACPPAHERYVVLRNGCLFTATPCYGMHSPWWVVATMEGEAPPVPIERTDAWAPLEEYVERLAPTPTAPGARDG
jgi:hypothetical protein